MSTDIAIDTENQSLAVVSAEAREDFEGAQSANAPEPVSFDLIPDGTLAWVKVNVRPVSLQGGVIEVTNRTGSKSLDLELVFIGGPYSGRKFWDAIMTAHPEGKGVQGGQAALKAIIETMGIAHPDNKASYRVPNYMAFDGMVAAVKVGAAGQSYVDPISSTEAHSGARNFVKTWLSPHQRATRGEFDALVAREGERPIAPTSGSGGDLLPSAVRLPQGHAQPPSPLTSRIGAICNLSLAAGMNGELSIYLESQLLYTGPNIADREFDRLCKEFLHNGTHRELFTPPSRRRIRVQLDQAGECNDRRLGAIGIAEASFLIDETDERCGRAALAVARSSMSRTITVHLTDAEAERLAEGDEKDLAGLAVRTAKVQKKLEDEQTASKLEHQCDQHMKLVGHLGVATHLTAEVSEVPSCELDGTILRLTYTADLSALFAFDRPIDTESEQGDEVVQAIARIMWLVDEPDDNGVEFSADLLSGPIADVLADIGRRCTRPEDVPGSVPLVNPGHLLEAGRLFHRARYNLDRVKKLWKRQTGKAEREEALWLIDNFVPLGEVVLIAGEGGSGKSTFGHELAIAFATPAGGDHAPFSWSGRSIDGGRAGEVLFITMEESPKWFAARGAKLDPLDEAESLLVEYCETKDDLGRILAEYGSLTQKTGAPRLVVIDSASKFREGSELNDQDVNAFFEPLERFARHTGATVVVIHHLNKDGRASKPVRTAQALRARVSGHSAFINRPRLVFGMYREGESPEAVTRIGVIKENVGLGHLEGVMEPYRRDQETYRHIRVAEPEPRPARKRATASASAPGKALGVPDPDLAALVLSEIADITAGGGKVARTGQHGLYNQDRPSLSGRPRAKLWAAVDWLVDAGQLDRAADGSLSVAPPASAPPAAE